MCVYVYTYMAVELLSGPSLANLRVTIWAEFEAIELGFQRFLFKRCNCNIRAKGFLSGASWPYLCCTKLGPDSNPPHFLHCFGKKKKLFLSAEIPILQ